MTKVMRKEARHTQRRDRASGVPLEILEPDVLTVQQTAELLSVCKNTIYKLIRENDLPCRRIGSAIRIRKNDVMDYIRQ